MYNKKTMLTYIFMLASKAKVLWSNHIFYNVDWKVMIKQRIWQGNNSLQA